MQQNVHFHSHLSIKDPLLKAMYLKNDEPRRANVGPFFKKGIKKEETNYRPISSIFVPKNTIETTKIYIIMNHCELKMRMALANR